MIEFLSMMLGLLVVAIVYAGYQIGRLVEVQARPISMRLGPEWTETAQQLVDQVRFLDSTARLCSEELVARLDRIADKNWR